MTSYQGRRNLFRTLSGPPTLRRSRRRSMLCSWSIRRAKFKHVGHTRFPGDQRLQSLRVNPKLGLSTFTPADVRKVYTTMQNQKVTFYPPSTKETTTPSPVTTTEPSSLSSESSVSLSTPIRPSPVVSSSKTPKSSKHVVARVAGIPPHCSEKCITVYTTDRRCSKHYRNGKRIAKEAGVSKAVLAYRWVMYDSMLSAECRDGIVVRTHEFPLSVDEC